MRTSIVEQQVTFQENLHTARILWQDETAYATFGTGGKTTKKRVYKELFGKKARKRYAQVYPYLTKKEINEIVKIHAEHLKKATIVMHAASLLHGELRRANQEARRLTEDLPHSFVHGAASRNLSSLPKRAGLIQEAPLSFPEGSQKGKTSSIRSQVVLYGTSWNACQAGKPGVGYTEVGVMRNHAHDGVS